MPEDWTRFTAPGGISAARAGAGASFSRRLRIAIDGSLTPHQRQVFVALALNGIPIDVLAERLDTTRGALYKTLHDARRKLRQRLELEGHLGESSPVTEAKE